MRGLSIYNMEKSLKEVDFKGYRQQNISKSPSVFSVQIYLTPEVNFPHDVMNAEITLKINLGPNELMVLRL